MKAPQRSDKDEDLIDETFFHHSFMLPDFSAYDEDFKHFLKANLIESSHLVNLEKSGMRVCMCVCMCVCVMSPLCTFNT